MNTLDNKQKLCYVDLGVKNTRIGTGTGKKTCTRSRMCMGSGLEV